MFAPLAFAYIISIAASLGLSFGALLSLSFGALAQDPAPIYPENYAPTHRVARAPAPALSASLRLCAISV
jgi:hypothetical protein